MADGPAPPLGWGFIGAGGVARRRMLPALQGVDEIAVAAVAVRDQTRADALAEEFGAAAAYDSAERLLADPGVEVVYIATPPAVHLEHAVASARAGKHILLEKPMAMSVAECDTMLREVADAGVHLAVCFPMRHTAAVRHLKRWADRGDLGELTYLRAQMAKWYPLDENAWRADPEQAGGGVVMDLGSHLLDLACHLGGPIADVSCRVANRAWDLPVEDTAGILVQFESGAMGVLEMSFAAHTSDNAIEWFGTRGIATTRSPRGARAMQRVVDGETEEVPLDSVDVYRAEALDFCAAVRRGTPAATSGEDGRRNQACLEAAYRSAGSGRAERPEAPA